MAGEPTTVNGALIIPNTGDLVNLWGAQALNPDFVALDGTLWGVQTISASSSPIVLTAPAGFTPTPSGGPTQAQNRILIFTGALTAGVQVTLPIPGEYTIQNLTTGAFVLSFRAAGSGNVVATPQGSIKHVWNDGTNVWLVKNKEPGELTFYGGISAVPAWITACTIPPYLLCDGSVYNYATFPALSALYQGQFGGNGITTFAVQDLQGRVPLAYDGTGVRITTAGSGIAGQTMGAAGGGQNETLVTLNLPPYTPKGSVATTFSFTPSVVPNGSGFAGSAAASGQPFYSSGQYQILTVSSSFTGSAQGGASEPVVTVQPSQVSGIWLVAT